MTSTTSFQLRLTPGELFYTAGLLGFDRAALIGQPFVGWTEPQIRAQMSRGKQLLEERGWIRPIPGGKTEMDETLAGLVRLTTMPDFSVEVTTHSRQLKGSTALIFPIESGMLLIQMDGPDYLFSIFPPGAYDPFLLLRQVGIKQQATSQTAPAPISGQAFSDLARSVFIDQLTDEQIRKVHPQEQAWIEASLPRVQFLARLALLRWENGAIKTVATREYTGNPSELWQVSQIEDTANYEFLPISAEQVFKTDFFVQS